MNRAFSKIWILIILAVFTGGVIFVWEYFGGLEEKIEEEIAPGKEAKAPEEIEKPYIEVLSPNGGEKIEIGNKYTITWKISNIANLEDYFVMPYLRKGDIFLGPISNKGIRADALGYNWDWIGIPNYFDNGNLKAAAAGNDYKIKVELNKTGPVKISEDESDDYFSIIGKTEISEEQAQQEIRDLTREIDLRQIVSAMELYYDVEYFRSKLMPTSIGVYLNPVPKDPSGNFYHWLDNTSGANTSCDSQHYCVWAELEGGGYFTASEKGTKELLIKPTKCPCW